MPTRSQASREELALSLPALRRYARRLAGDPARADDLVQETMLKALANAGQFARGTNQRAWLHAILKNCFLSEMRKNGREIGLDAAPEPATRTMSPSQEATIRLDELSVALRRLPQSQRDAMKLVGVDGHSYEEAAAYSGCAVGTIKSRVSRARESLAAYSWH